MKTKRDILEAYNDLGRLHNNIRWVDKEEKDVLGFMFRASINIFMAVQGKYSSDWKKLCENFDSLNPDTPLDEKADAALSAFLNNLNEIKTRVESKKMEVA